MNTVLKELNLWMWSHTLLAYAFNLLLDIVHFLDMIHDWLRISYYNEIVDTHMMTKQWSLNEHLIICLIVCTLKLHLERMKGYLYSWDPKYCTNTIFKFVISPIKGHLPTSFKCVSCGGFPSILNTIFI